MGIFSCQTSYDGGSKSINVVFPLRVRAPCDVYAFGRSQSLPPRSWWDTWKDYSGFTLDHDNAPTIRQRRADEMLPARPSEIDNSGLVVDEINKDSKNLKPNLVEGRDYILLYESTCKLLQIWYGGETAFMRQWVGGTNDSAFVEVYMLQLIIRRSSDNKEAQLFITREVQHRNPHYAFPATQPVCGLSCLQARQILP